MVIKAIIFGLDGVLCSTDAYHYRAWKKVADSLGIMFDKESYRRIRGLSRTGALDSILERYDGNLSDAEKETLTEQKNEYLKEYLSDLSLADLPADILCTLEELRKRKDLLLAVACPSGNTRLILQQIGLGSFFDAVSDGNGLTGEMSFSWVFLKAAQMLRLAPEQCLAVEARESGAQGAWDAGMTVVCVGDAAGQNMGHYQLKSIRELMDLPELQFRKQDV